jgi:hypothetical protein
VYIGLQPPQPFKWLFSRIPQAPATVGWRILQVPRISSAPRRFLVSRAKPRAPRVCRVLGPPALQVITLPQLAAIQYHYPVVSRKSHRDRAQGARFSVVCAKPAPLPHIVLWLPHACNPPLSRSKQVPAIAFCRLSTGPIDTEPRRLVFGFARQTGPPLCIFGCRPSRPANDPSPPSYNPTLLSAGVVLQVPSISRPYGANFGFARQTGPLMHFGF